MTGRCTGLLVFAASLKRESSAHAYIHTIPYYSTYRAAGIMTKISCIRTPDARFHNLPGFPYHPHYLTFDGLRVAYIDESNHAASLEQAETFLCLHGQPTWSYLYRKMISVFLQHTTLPKPPPRRVICPDLLGFGRSDKPKHEKDYNFNLHRQMLMHLIRSLDLRNITLVVQDWGGLLGLTLPIEEPSRFKRLLVMNTTLATGQHPGEGFEAWKAYCNRTPDMDIGRLIQRGLPNLSQAEAAAYNAPYPSSNYKSGVRSFPNLVMVEPDMEGVEESKRSVDFYRRSEQFAAQDIVMAVGMQDPVLGPPVMKSLAQVWRNGCLWTEIQGAGHFVQEWGDEVAKRALVAFENNGTAQNVTLKQSRSNL